MDLKTILPYLNYNFSSESELVKSIELVSKNFTQNRENIGDYLKDTKLVAAYTCFYLLTNMPKLSAVFEKLELSIEDYRDYEFIDIGAGPGTFSLALLQMNSELNILGFEKSDVMIKQGEELVKGLFPKSDHQYFSKLNSIAKKQKKRFGIFGHSANEMEISFVLNLINELELDEVLFIEPGTKEFFRKSLIIRESLIKKFNILYPCKSKNSCPFLREDDWCHQYLKIRHEGDVERLTQLVQRDRRNLPITIHHYSKDQFQNSKSGDARIVRVYSPTKFSLEWQICHEEAEKNIICDLQVLTRGYKKPEIKRLQTILAGDEVSFSLVKELGDNKLRGKL